ncbi:hypothetical protein ACP8Y2_22865 [Herpetosiphon llansteffanensis]
MSISSASTPIGDVLQQIAQRFAQSSRSPLLRSGELALPDASTQPLPLAPELAVAWRALLGETGWPWQAEALATVRRGLGLALVAPAPLGPACLLLLAAEHISANQGSLLLLAPDAASLHDLAQTANNIDALLGGGFPHLVVEQSTRPPHSPARLILTTPTTLHQRMLRTHHRGWSNMWPQLNGIVLPAFDQANSTSFGHCRWLLRRVERLRPRARPLTLYASLAPVAEIDELLARVFDHLPPLVYANTARIPLTWALWNGGAQPVDAALKLALALRQAGLSVQLDAPDSLERAILAQRGAAQGLSLVPRAAAPAHVLVMLGGVNATSLPSLLASGHRAVVLVTDQSIAAQTALAQPALLTPNLPPALPIATQNNYISSSHLRCAAEERPLQQSEISAWEVSDLVERLTQRNQLAQLPDSPTWQPVANLQQRSDIYATLHPTTISDVPVQIVDHEGTFLAELDSVTVERRLFSGASVLGGRVVGWNDDGSLGMRLQDAAPTLAEHRCSVSVREQFGQRPLDGARAEIELTIGRVVVTEEIVARRSLADDGSMRRVPFEPPIQLQWNAPALWLAAPEAGAGLGEILLGVLPLLLRCQPDAMVACLSEQQLYLVEAQPGGRGIVEQLYSQFEAWLHLAGLAARTLSKDPIYASYAQAELRWLEKILVPLAAPLRADMPPEPAQIAPPRVERASRQSMVISTNELNARRRGRGNVFALPRSLPKQGEAVKRPTAPLPSQPALPAQPMRLAAQQPPASKPITNQRPAVRNEAPPAPPAPEKAKPNVTRPPRRKASVGRNEAQRSTQPLVQPKAAAPSNQLPPERGSVVVPAPNEPPAYERPPFQQRNPQEKPATQRPISRPVQRETQPNQRPAQRETQPNQRPAQREQQPARPYQRNDQPTKPMPRETQPNQSPNQRPYQRNDQPTKPMPRESQPNQRPAQREQRPIQPNLAEQPVRPYQRNEQPAKPVEASADPQAMLEKARRLREQREAEARVAQPITRPNSANYDAEPSESRFKQGDRVHCVPYGEGVVQKTRIRDGRELLLVQFPELGDLRVDPAVNAVRIVRPEIQADDDE